MKPVHKRLFTSFATGFTVLSMLINLLFPALSLLSASVAYAQEVTEEPIVTETSPAPAETEAPATDVPTEPPTQAPTEAPTTDAPTEPPAVEPTEAPTAEATAELTEEPTAEVTAEPTAELTEEPTAAPTEPPALLTFQDDFQDGNADEWLLTPGWQVATEGDNLFLSAVTPNETATIANVALEHFALAVRVRLDAGNTASVAFRVGTENYAVALDANGHADLYRGASLLAAGPAIEPASEGTPAAWHTLNIQALGGVITVSVNGALQIEYADPAPLTAGAFVFSTGAANTGAAAFDQVIITELEAPVVVPTLEPTVEATAEATAEVTEEPEATETATAEPTPTGNVVLSADFESELTGWVLGEGASVVVESEANHALLMAAGSSLLPADALFLADFQIDARLNIVTDTRESQPSGVSVFFRTQEGSSYVLSVEGAQTVLSRNDGSGLVALASTAASHVLNTWHTLSLSAQGGHIVATVNGVVEIDYTDETPLISGQIALVANAASTIMLDDIVVTDFTTAEAAPTLTPLGLTEETRRKMDSLLLAALEAYLNGDQGSALAMAASSNIDVLDDAMRVNVVIWGAEGITGQDLVPGIEAVGGVVELVGDYQISAQVPLPSLVAIVNLPEVGVILLPDVAVPTGPVNAPAEEGLNTPAGSVFSEGFNVIGANDWHAAGILSSAAVDIAVIDVDFNFNGSAAADRSCLNSVTTAAGYAGGVSTTGHGTRMVEIICDIAPNADVIGYQANDVDSVANAINTADNSAEIIVIGLDLGANISPGDGVNADVASDVNTLYTNIDTATGLGALVIAAAGNNTGRYISVNYTGSAITVNMTGSQNDVVNVSWDDWGVAGDIPMTLNGTGMTAQAKPARPSGATPPSHRFTVTSCTNTPNCDLTLDIPAGAGAAYVQVQIMDASGNNTAAITSPAGDPNAGNLARPADSPNAFTVGAVCARPDDHYRLTELSSRGPVFGSGGAAPTGTPALRTDFKPDVVGPSDVNVSDPAYNLEVFFCDDFDGEGFTGTSAAAAHIAGMAALLRSATNSNITSAYPVNSASNVTARQAIMDYMLSHTIDLGDTPGGLLDADLTDGFDMLYGAGLPVLGNPAPSYPIRVDTGALAAATCATGPVVYVNPNNLGDADVTGGGSTIADGFVHPGYAIQQAAANSCIVLLPGEYVTSIPITDTNGKALQSYDSAHGTMDDSDAASVFWVNDSFKSGGGIDIGDGNIDVIGFDFLSANPLDASAFSPITFLQPVAIEASFSNGNTLGSNTFTGFGDVIVAGRSPVRIFDAQNVIIENSTFSNNDADGGAAIQIRDSIDNGLSASTLVQDNTFTNNTNSQPTFNSPLIQISDSFARIYNNRITNNNTQTIIRVQNPASSTYEVQVFGNLIVDNANLGPVVHLDPGERFRFVNNTVVSNNAIQPGAPQYDGIIIRGNPSGTPNGGGQWDVHNNVFFDNASSIIIDDVAPSPSGCSAIGGGSDNGVRNNWAQASGSTTTGDCLFAWAGNSNIITNPPDLAAAFIGAFSPTDPYQLKDGTAGIDAGDNSALGTIAATTDVLVNPRLSNGTVDMGAYELIPLQPVNIDLTGVNAILEDTASVALPLDAVGGFAPYSFEIETFPANFSTNSANDCLGQPLFFNTTSQQWMYCPPANFYTGGGGAPANVSFTYRVRDAADQLSGIIGNVTIEITPTDDPMTTLTDPSQNVLAEVNSSFSFRIRPYVRFNNFRFSESSAIPSASPGADYAYTYTFTGVTGGDPNVVGGLAALTAAVNGAGASGSLVNLTAGPDPGFVDFTYDVTDSNAETRTGLTATINIVGSLPDSGVHDDTSFAFNYHGNWLPIYSEPNINNTLHRTMTLNDQADFFMIGTGFVLYMQGYAAGGNWELQVDGSTIPWNGAMQVTTADGITCRTSQLTTTTNFISNRSRYPYTVSCDGLLDDEPHIISIINRAALQLNVDAAGIIEDGAVLRAGVHEINEPQTLPLFPQNNWTQISDIGAAGGIAMSTTNPNVADITFDFQGTGFAIGTILERTSTFQGAQYDICVAPAAFPANQACQSFDNTLSATTRATWNIYRPFFGFNPDSVYTVTINVTSITGTTGRMVIDSIVVFDDLPLDTLPFGDTEDDQVGLMVFGGGMADNWALDTNNTRTSNRSLTSIVRGVPFAGPYISFQIPDDADTINWLRYASTRDSRNILICVDRGQGENVGVGDQDTFCIERDLRTSSNPLVISESDFDGGAGWGNPWDPDGSGPGGMAHTVEIFSLANETFNIDKVQVINSGNGPALLAEGYYEETITGVRWFTEDSGNYDLLPVGDPGNFAPFTQTLASNRLVMRLLATGGAVDGNGFNEGMFFQFTGTGFSVYFTLDRKADAVQACWLNTAPVADDTTVENIFNTGTCQTWDNESLATRYQAARSVLGLPAGDYSVAVRMLADQGQPDAHLNNIYETPITMLVDALAIYNDPLPGTLLDTTGQRYETSFVNRVADDTFLYYGSRWISRSGRAYLRYSGSNYDNTVNQIGAGVVFHTDNADTLTLYRDTRSGYSPLEICVLRLSDDSRRCAIYDNAGGTAYQAAINVPLFDGTNEHTVSISTMYTGAFNLDAVELTNTSVLQPGLNQETHPGITYSTTGAAPLPTSADWRNVFIRSYTDGAAMQSNTSDASVSFQFNGTGFSLHTLFDFYSSPTVNVEITGPVNPAVQTFALYSAATRYGSAYSFTGLPSGLYTVTITEADGGTKQRMTVDAIEVYGDYDPARVMGLGFYDDAQLNANGDLFMDFGPSSPAWTVRTGTSASTSLGRTNHNNNRYGAHVTFQVSSADAVTLHHRSSNSTLVRVCAALSGGGDAPTCETASLVGATSTTFTGPFDNGVNNYNISITNLSHVQYLYVDAIGVHNTSAPGNLTEGVYQENHPQLAAAFQPGTGDWLVGSVTDTMASDNTVRSTGTGNSGEQLVFTFDGTGFSILLVQSTLTSNTYTVDVSTVGDVTNDVTFLPAPSTAKKQVALTYVGLANGTYTVTLTNTDATKPLLVDRVDILGDTTTTIPALTTGRIENTDARIRYLPFLSLLPVTNASASSGSQHVGMVQGSVVYFQYTGGSFEYVRQTLSSYGLVDICFDAISTPISVPCAQPGISNATAPFGYQQSQMVNPGSSSTRWVAIRNTDGKNLPFDYARAIDPNAPLTAGYYEETFPSNIIEFNGAWNPAAITQASGGSVNVASNVGDNMLFQFDGTGFSVYFTLDRYADEVRICWVDGSTLDQASVLSGGTCQLYDNQSAASRYRAARTILGLSAGPHTAVVEMRDDNDTPATHLVTALPLSMQVDAIAIYGEDPATMLTPLDTLGTRYETSFVNAAADDRFLYYGTGWTSVSGPAARLYSGSNYDRIYNNIGAGVVFRTNNADAIMLYRDVRTGYTPLEVCAIGAARQCITVVNTGGVGNQQPAGILLNTTGAMGVHTVTITTLEAGYLYLDAIELVDSTSPLGVGLHEESHPALRYSETAGVSDWYPIYSRLYSDGRMMETKDADAEMIFSFNGTGFEIGTLVDRYGGEVEICYISGITTDFTGANCYEYQNESTIPRYTVSRTVTGLAAGDYSVRVRNVEDGTTVLLNPPGTLPRSATYTPARLRVDYVRIFDDVPVTLTQAGWYNENATDGSGNPFLQLLPADGWASFTGTAARLFTNMSYVGVVTPSNGRISNVYAGPVATLRVQVPAEGATVVLYTGTASTTNSDQMLICADNVTDSGTDCVIQSVKTANQIVVSPTELPALGTPGAHTLTFRALTTGYFRIDGFQVIFGTTLTPGIYDDALASSGGLLDISGTGWAPYKFSRSYNGGLMRTRNLGDALAFTMQGTGFGFITQYDFYAVDMSICWVQGTGGFTYPLDAAGESCEFVGNVDSFTGTNPNIDSITMSGVLIDTSEAEINGVIAINRRVRIRATFEDPDGPGGPLPGEIFASEVVVIPTTAAYQYGIAEYGLPFDFYSVEVRHIDANATTAYYLRLDAIAVFGNAPAAMDPGLYDDASATINFAPEPFWTVTTAARFGPPRGPYQLTEHTTPNHGTIAQLNVNGNGFILYQTAYSRNSRVVRVCLVTPNQPNECSDFSQYVARPAYFTPIAFFGFGTGSHEVIIENRQHGPINNMSVDGVRVLP